MHVCSERKGPMIVAAVKRMISMGIIKFETTVCLDVGPVVDSPSISFNVAQYVQEDFEIVASSSTHEEVNTREVARCTVILCTQRPIKVVWGLKTCIF